MSFFWQDSWLILGSFEGPSARFGMQRNDLQTDQYHVVLRFQDWWFRNQKTGGFCRKGGDIEGYLRLEDRWFMNLKV